MPRKHKAKVAKVRAWERTPAIERRREYAFLWDGEVMREFKYYETGERPGSPAHTWTATPKLAPSAYDHLCRVMGKSYRALPAAEAEELWAQARKALGIGERK